MQERIKNKNNKILQILKADLLKVDRLDGFL